MTGTDHQSINNLLRDHKVRSRQDNQDFLMLIPLLIERVHLYWIASWVPINSGYVRWGPVPIVNSIAKGEEILAYNRTGLRVLCMASHRHVLDLNILCAALLQKFLQSKGQVFGVSRRPCSLAPSGIGAPVPQCFGNKSYFGYLCNSKETQVFPKCFLN